MDIYLPEENAGLIEWAERFKKGFPEFGKSKGFPEDKIQVILQACDRLIAMCNKSEQDKTTGKTDDRFEDEKMQFAKALGCLYN